MSNIAPRTLQAYDPRRHTNLRDVIKRGPHLHIRLRWTKTLQSLQQAVYVPVGALPGHQLDPVAAWREYAGAVAAQGAQPPDAPLLLRYTKDGWRPMSQSLLRSQFNQALQAAGLQHKHYTLHSLRRGGATTAYYAGVPVKDIMIHGTWISDAILLYLKSLPPVASSVVKALTMYITQSS